MSRDFVKEEEEEEEEDNVWLSRGRRRGSLMLVKFSLESAQTALEANLTLDLSSKWLLLSEVVWHTDSLSGDDMELLSEEISTEKMTYNKIERLLVDPAVSVVDNSTAKLNINDSTAKINLPPRVVATTDQGPGYTEVILASLSVIVLLLLIAIFTILKKGRQRIFSKNCFLSNIRQDDLEENPAYKSRLRLGMDLGDAVYQEPRRSTILKRTSRNRSCGTLINSPSLLSPVSFISSPTTLLSSPSLFSPSLDHHLMMDQHPSRFGSTPHFHRPSSALPPALPPPTSYSFSLELDTFDTPPNNFFSDDPNISHYMTPVLPRHEERHYAASDIFSPQPKRVMEPKFNEERGVSHLGRLPRMSPEFAFLGHF